MLVVPAVLVALSTTLPLPLYTDDEAAVFAVRAEKLMANIDAKKMKPGDFHAILRELKIDRRRLGVVLPETRDVMVSDEYRLSEHFILIHHPSGHVAVLRREKK